MLVPVAFNPAENTASSKALVRDSAILGKTCLLEEGSRPRSRLLRRALARRQAGPRGNLPKRRGPAKDFLHQLKMLMLNRPLFGGTEISLRWTGRTKNSGCFSKKPSLLNVKFTFHILRRNFYESKNQKGLLKHYFCASYYFICKNAIDLCSSRRTNFCSLPAASIEPPTGRVKLPPPLPTRYFSGGTGTPMASPTARTKAISKSVYTPSADATAMQLCKSAPRNAAAPCSHS